MNSVKTFRYVSIAEGVSLLLLLGIAMPLKYIFHEPFLVKTIGMAHGVLFIIYVIFAIAYKFKAKWSFLEFLIVLVSSIVPFGTFYADKKYISKLKA